MRPEDVAVDMIAGRKIFHYGSITMIGEPSRSATLAAVKAAQDAGLMISYDPNLRMSLWPDAESARAGMLAGLEHAQIVKISDDELEFLTGGRDVTPLWRPQMQLIAVTRGAKGAAAYTRGGQVDSPGFSVRSLDTTGAGDGFVAGLLVGILEAGADYVNRLASILRFANAVGALATTQYGAIPALPSRAAVETFLQTAS